MGTHLQATVEVVKWLTIILLYKVGATMKSELKGATVGQRRFVVRQQRD